MFQIKNIASECDYSTRSFREVRFVMTFLYKLIKEFRYQKFSIEGLSGYSQELQGISPNMTAQIFVIFEIYEACVIFLKFSENLNLIFFQKRNSQSCSWGLSEYSQGLQILTPNVNTQLFVVCYIDVLFDFLKSFSENFNFFFFSLQNLKFFT